MEGTVVVVGGQMGGMPRVQVEDISLSRAVFGISSWQALDSTSFADFNLVCVHCLSTTAERKEPRSSAFHSSEHFFGSSSRTIGIK